MQRINTLNHLPVFINFERGTSMFQNLGQQIRLLRERKGITLNAFAKELGVSTGYLSQLETGKTENISLKVLEKLQGELSILSLEKLDDETSYRFERIQQQYNTLLKNNPDAAEYLLSTFENGLDYFSKRKRASKK